MNTPHPPGFIPIVMKGCSVLGNSVIFDHVNFFLSPPEDIFSLLFLRERKGERETETERDRERDTHLSVAFSYTP